MSEPYALELEAGSHDTWVLGQLAQHPRSLATLADRLHLTGTTAELRALCSTVDRLEAAGYVQQWTAMPGELRVKFSITTEGRQALATAALASRG